MAYSMKTLEQTRTLLGAPQSNDSLKLRQKRKVLEEKLEKLVIWTTRYWDY